MNRLVTLGTKGGPALRPGGPWPTSSLVEIGGRVIVVDCGLGVTRGLTDAGVALKRLDTILVTHLHSDHVLEFGALLHTAWTAGLSTRVVAHGPKGLKAVFDGFLAMMAFDIETRIADEGRPPLTDLVEVREHGEGGWVAEPDLTVTALRNHHPPVVESFALSVEAGGRRVVFSGDTAPLPALARFAHGADVLVHEALYLPGVDRLVARTANGATLKAHLLASHTPAAEAGRIARLAHVRHLVLHHLVPADDPEVREDHWRAEVREDYGGPLTIARDGTSLDLDTLHVTHPARIRAEVP